MARAGNGGPSALAIVGLLCGMLLLAVAGTLAVMDANITGIAARRLQYGFATPTTTAPSMFDSSDSSSSSGSILEPSKSFESQSSRTMGLLPEQGGTTWAVQGGSVTGHLFIMLCFAFLYKKKAVDPVLQKLGTLESKMQNFEAPEHDDFDNTICECFSDKWVCIHGLCCPLVRMAHTNAIAGVMGFWETAFCWCCCAWWSAGMGPCCLMVYFRMRLKAVMKIEDHLINDFCITLFCPLLSICQMGTAVDTAMNYEVEGCCDLKFNDEYDR